MSDAPAPGRPPQRRQVSVLFLDIVGSTALIGQLDPEDVSEVMDGALRRFSEVVQARGGRVLQYAGDSLLAAFGADHAREDDAERAVHAGLDMLAAARMHAAQVRRDHGLGGFDIRVGVHTGHVLLGGGVDEDGTIRGYTVNIAARLEQSAPAGMLRISQDTWRQVRGVFDAQAQPPLRVKGHDETLVTYLVSGARPLAGRTPGRGIEGVAGAFIGRDAELARLLAAFERTAAGDGLQAMTLLAEAGLGKSRLLHELQLRLAAHTQRCWLLQARSQPGSLQQPYALLRDVLAGRLQIADSDSGEVARGRLVQGLLPFFAADGEAAALRQAELLGQLIGMDFSASPRLAAVMRDPRLLRDGAIAALATYLQRLAASDGSPVVLLLDDLQWSDDASLDLLEQLRLRTELPLTVVLAARPALVERRAGWGQGWERHETLALAPLNAADRRVLLRTLLQRVQDAPAELLAMIDNQAEGNPYYAEELVQMFIDIGAIDTAGEPWRVRTDRLAGARVPGTLVGVLQARLDALAATERHAMQAASIVGPVFWDDALRALDAAATEALPELQRKAMVHLRPVSAFEGTREEGFHHHLLHQVTYDTLLKAERRAGHAQAARWLAERVGDRMAEYLALTGEHYERAGDAARAIDWLERAAVAAEERFANTMALATLARLLAMPELDDPRRRFALLGKQSNIADLVGDRVLQASALDIRWQIAEALDDDALRAHVMALRALLSDRLGHLSEAYDLAERAAAIAEGSGNAVPAALGYGELGWLHLQRGAIGEAEASFRSGLRWARRAALEMKQATDDTYEPMLLTMTATALSAKHDYEGALSALREGLALAQARHRVRTLCGCHDWLVDVALKLFDLPLAQAHTDALAEAAQQVGSAALIVQARVWRAEIALRAGRHAEAAVLAQACAEAAQKQGDPKMAGFALGIAGEAYAANGQTALAREMHQLSHDSHARAEQDFERLANRLLIADTWRAEGNVARALAQLEPEMAALEARDALGTSNRRVTARMAAWRVLAAAADRRATQQLEWVKADLDQTVSQIRDPAVRDRILTAPPLHRDITAAWAAHALCR
ncbi:MAG: adenylate/guanylate cyclase domain-containing protein [Burkholderiales bacterium]